MNFDEVKTAATALPRDEREKLINYLVCLGVSEEPEWLEAMRESTERHADRYRSEKSGSMRVAEGE
jgi:hypothetical protein